MATKPENKAKRLNPNTVIPFWPGIPGQNQGISTNLVIPPSL